VVLCLLFVWSGGLSDEDATEIAIFDVFERRF